MAEVAFEQVRKSFGAMVALQGLDLHIPDGAFVSLLGPSGCGKTTTLRMLAGLEQPTGGTIRIGDRVVNGVPPSQRDIAMVFQSYALYPHMSVRQNMAYPLRKRGVREPERSQRVDAAAKLLELEALLDRKPKQLSGGQQQRVALGRALVREPKAFLLDEPLSNLDAKLRAHMRAELIQLHRRIGCTMVYVTHDQLEAMTMSDRIAVMEGGVLQQYASPAEIYSRPANAFVASFIGTPAMSLIDATLSKNGGGVELRAGAMTLALPADFLHGGELPSKARLAIRPEDITLFQGPHRATVKLVEPTGHESIVTLDIGGADLVARHAGDALPKAGETIDFAVRTERVHVFTAETGKRLNADREVASASPARRAAG